MARPALRREDVGDFSQLSVPIFSGILDLSTACNLCGFPQNLRREVKAVRRIRRVRDSY